jgi:hypothetical protein
LGKLYEYRLAFSPSYATFDFFQYSCHEIKEVRPTKVKNIGIWIRYDSRSGSHNACVTDMLILSSLPSAVSLARCSH